MINHLRKKLTMTYTLTYGAVFLFLLCLVFMIWYSGRQKQIRMEFYNDFSGYMEMLEGDRFIKYSFLQSEELRKGYGIFIFEGDRPLGFQGAHFYGEKREVILEEALNKYQQNDFSEEFKVNGENYKILQGKTKDGKVHLFLCKDNSAFNKELAKAILLGGVTVLIGGLVLFWLSRILTLKAVKPIIESRKQQNEFLHAASHELKSPIATIRANATVIPLNEEKKEQYIRVIEGECDRMGRLIEDLMMIIAAEGKTWQLRNEMLSIDTVLIDCFETYEPVCHNNGIILKLSLPDRIMQPILGDGFRIEQILNILIDNAIAHSKSKKIIIKAYEKKKEIVIEVMDFGVGIPEEKQEYIFSRFYCGDASRNDKTHFGLGLSIAKEMIQMMDGRIAIRNTPGGGSTFVIRLVK